jgi:2'-5' RNA ligase
MYFIAILAPDSINQQVLQWKYFMRDRFSCVVALKSPAHITLISPFCIDSGLQPLLEASLDSFSSQRRKFLVTVKNFDSFKPRVIFVHVEQSKTLEQLKEDLENILFENSLFPIKKETRAFHPHITLANRDLHKKDFLSAWEHFKNRKYKHSFQADGISLMKHTGAKWDTAYTATFPLI